MPSERLITSHYGRVPDCAFGVPEVARLGCGRVAGVIPEQECGLLQTDAHFVFLDFVLGKVAAEASGDDGSVVVEHDDLLGHGWTVTEGKAGGGAGYSTRADNGRRERLWLSPGCRLAQDVLDFGEPA